MHLTLDGHGKCAGVEQTQNVAEAAGCVTKTRPWKCPFDEQPGWYWPHAGGEATQTERLKCVGEMGE